MLWENCLLLAAPRDPDWLSCGLPGCRSGGEGHGEQRGQKVERAGVGGRQRQEDVMEKQLMPPSEAGRACPPLEGSASICEPHPGPVHRSRWERLRVL